MGTHMKRTLLFFALAGGCGTIQAVSSMTNPARTTDKIEATQAYEIGPTKENHQYQATIASWTPQEIGVRLKLLDVDKCSQYDSYTFTMVDDHGARAHLRLKATPTQSTRPGRAGMTVKESQVEGAFDAAIGADSKYLVIEQRPVWGYDCPSIDFRWNLQ
jgi:hypothetical protein